MENLKIEKQSSLQFAHDDKAEVGQLKGSGFGIPPTFLHCSVLEYSLQVNSLLWCL